MASDARDSDDPLSPAERARLAGIRSAESLAALVDVTGAASEHDAYLAAKGTWADLRERELPDSPGSDGLYGTRVEVDGVGVHVHGITHADTPEERAYLHAHVPTLLEAGAAVYCEQGIRSMYFDDLPAVRTMDDYRWAIRQYRALDRESTLTAEAFDGFDEDVSVLAATIRDTLRSLAEAGGEGFERTFVELVPEFLRSHADLATGESGASFALTRRAAHDPALLFDLQRHYAKTFLPQPLEREWLRRHDPELELLTHARNERMADYVLYHRDDGPAVHLVVGAAHQPGVAYYLRRHRDGERDLSGFDPIA